MPSATELVAQLSDAANTLVPLAVAWHLVLAAIFVALVRRWRPRERTVAAILAALAGSVAISALVVGNPFNAVSFSLLAILLVTTSASAVITRAPAWQRWFAALLITYGAVYPHFLHAPAVAYLVAAPVGVVPCPTLAMIAGLALLTNLRSRPQLLVMALWTSIYAAIGVAHFGLWLDLGLAVGTACLLVAASGRAGLRLAAMPGDGGVADQPS